MSFCSKLLCVKPNIFSKCLTALIGATLLAAPAFAQAGGALPLASVSNQSWATPFEELRIIVPSGTDAPLALEVYSPGLNLNDYVNGRATIGYYGDEIYGRNLPFETTYTVLSPGGTKLFERKYSTTDKHTWEGLTNLKVQAGIYILRVKSTGNGKNTFAVRANSPYQIQASQFTVNAKGAVNTDLLAARLQVSRELVSKRFELTNYDADGAQEAELYAVSPDGQRRKLATSENGGQATDGFDITNALVGEWSIFMRILPSTKQFSNAINLRVRINQQPAYADIPAFIPPQGLTMVESPVVEVVDQSGRPIPGSGYSLAQDGDYTMSPNLPTGWVPVSASVLEGQGTVVSSTLARTQPGAARVRFVARPIQGQLIVETVAIIGKTRVPITGIPFRAAGQSLRSPSTLTVTPNEYPVTPTPLPGSTVEPKSGLVKDNQITRVVLEYRISATLKLEVSPNILATCQQSLLTATAATDFPYPVPVSLGLRLPKDITTGAPLELNSDISGGKPAVLQIPARVCAAGTIRAELEPFDLITEGMIRVLPPSGVTVSRVTDVQKGAVRIIKSYTQDAQGYIVTLAITVDRTIENFRIVDPLPQGGSSPAVRRPNPAVTGLVNNQTVAVNWRLEGNTFNLGRLVAGTYLIQYGIFTDLPADAVSTVPDLFWDEIR
jgi:hypothetical protein